MLATYSTDMADGPSVPSPLPQPPDQTSRFLSSTRPPFPRTYVLIANPRLVFWSDRGYGAPIGHLVTSISGSSALEAQPVAGWEVRGKELGNLHLHGELGEQLQIPSPRSLFPPLPGTGTGKRLGLACRISAALTFLLPGACPPPLSPGGLLQPCSLGNEAGILQIK